MKHTKRIISLVLALTMLCAMAISVSAYTYENNGSYTCSAGTCDYHTYANLTSSSWDALIELQYYTGSYTSYVFRTQVFYYTCDDWGNLVSIEQSVGTESTGIAGNSGSGYTLCRTEVNYYINGSKVDSTFATF